MVTAVTAVSDGRKGASKKMKGANSSISIDKSNFTVGMIDDEEFHMKTFDEGMIIMMMMSMMRIMVMVMMSRLVMIVSIMMSMIIMMMSMIRMIVMVMMGMINRVRMMTM